MNDKAQILNTMRAIFNRWDAFSAGLEEAVASDPAQVDHLSVREILAHLTAWQVRSIARVEAALQDREPVLPVWADGDYESDENIDRTNASIDRIYHDLPWPEVYAGWRRGFTRFLELSTAVPEADLLQPGRYPWLEGQPLSAVLLGSCEHHQEHLDDVLAAFGRRANPRR